MAFPYCQFGVGTETPDAPRRQRPCRALPTFEVAETLMRPTGQFVNEPAQQGWFPLGDYCTGHAITLAGVVGQDGRWTRAMRPLPVTVEVHGKR